MPAWRDDYSGSCMRRPRSARAESSSTLSVFGSQSTSTACVQACIPEGWKTRLLQPVCPVGGSHAVNNAVLCLFIMPDMLTPQALAAGTSLQMLANARVADVMSQRGRCSLRRFSSTSCLTRRSSRVVLLGERISCMMKVRHGHMSARSWC